MAGLRHPQRDLRQWHRLCTRMGGLSDRRGPALARLTRMQFISINAIRNGFTLQFQRLGRGDALAACGAFLLIFAVKLWLIGRFGSAVPFWDEWDGEAAAVYIPWMDGTFSLHDLLATHNEHRIVVTRLFSLLVFLLGGRWDVIIMMVVNAAIHAATLVIIALLLTPSKTPFRLARPLMLAFTVLVCSIPFGWENTLFGFQTPSYLLILFSFVSMSLIVGAPAFSPRWLLGAASGLLSILTIASGALSLVPSVGVGIIQMLRGRRRGRREIAALLVLAALTVAMLLTVPTIPGHAALKAKNAREFFMAFVGVASWPLPWGWAPLLQLPALLLVLRSVLTAPPRSDRSWIVLAGLFWLGELYAGTAYARADGLPLSSRYLDLFVLSQVMGFSALLHIARLNVLSPLPGERLTDVLKRVRTRAPDQLFIFAIVGLGIVWIAGLVAFDAWRFWSSCRPDIIGHWTASLMHEKLLRDYLLKGDPSGFGDPRGWIPYPDPGRLRMLLDNPHVRAMLPTELGGQAPPTFLTMFANATLAAAPWLLAAGAALLALGTCRIGERSRAFTIPAVAKSSSERELRLRTRRD